MYLKIITSLYSYKKLPTFFVFLLFINTAIAANIPYTCSQSLPITVNGVYTVEDLTQGNGCHSCEAAGHANWFSFTPGQSGVMSISSCTYAIDSRLFIHEGSCQNLIEIAAADDECHNINGDSFAAEALDIPVESGKTYFIEWTTFLNQDQSFNFSFEYIQGNDSNQNNCIDFLNIPPDGPTGAGTTARVSEGGPRTCGTENLMRSTNSPFFAQHTYKQKETKIRQYLQQKNNCNNPLKIPIAIHYQDVPLPIDTACLISLAMGQIEILNDDFQGINSDITKWNTENAPNYPGLNNGETCLLFCIANQNHPAGYQLQDGDLAITINQTTGDYNNDWTNYINIYIRDINYLGYAPIGGDGDGDGVVIDFTAFGTGDGCAPIIPEPTRFNKGRTLTHEMGHYLFLQHIWGDGDCNVDDGVSDTPTASAANYGCPSPSKTSCSSLDLHMNFMDYSDDECMYMFSAGQSRRMEAYISTSLSGAIDNAANVCFTNNGNNNLQATVGGNYQAENITATGVIPEATTVIFRAADNILLKPGFHAEVGADFLATIAPCNSSITPSPIAPNTIAQNFVETPPNTHFQLFPNPATTHLKLSLTIEQPQVITIKLYSVTGQLLQSIQPKHQTSKGTHHYPIDLTNTQAGVYFLEIITNNQIEVAKFVVQ